jgi:hypothetical protein
MDDLTITTWLWGHKYNYSDVVKLYSGFHRNLKQKHRFILFSEFPFSIKGVEWNPIPDLKLTEMDGCFARLRMFDPEFQAKHKLKGRIVCTDLDTIVTGNIDPLFDRSEPFLILQGANSINPCPYCGALMMFRAGAYPELWRDFNLEVINTIPFHEFPDDQGWIHYKIPDAAGWKAGTNGVYAFQKPGWPSGVFLPRDARLVTFNGWRSPKKFSSLDWVKQHWVA